MAKAPKKAAVKKPKKPKMKNNFFWGFNIKLVSNERSGEDVYYELIHKIFTDGIAKHVGGDKAVSLRNQFSKEYTFDGHKHKVLYGKINRYTLLEGSQWYNEVTKEYEVPALPKGIYPNGFETDYVFIPAAHRFFVLVTQKVSLSIVHTFLSKALKDVIGIREDFVLKVMQSQDTIDAIINAAELKDLYIDVTVTNDDAGDKAQQAIDKLLKINNVGELQANIKPDNSGKLNTKEEFIRGLLELAKDNGTAEAHIVNDAGKKQKVVTSDFPEKVLIKIAETDDINSKLFTNIMEKYRNEPAAD